MRDRAQFWLVLLTFLGMVGLYVGGYLAYQKYQEYQQKGTVGSLLSLFGKS